MKVIVRAYVYAAISALGFCTALMCFKLGWEFGGCVWLFNSGIWLAASRLAFRIVEGRGPDA